MISLFFELRNFHHEEIADRWFFINNNPERLHIAWNLLSRALIDGFTLIKQDQAIELYILQIAGLVNSKDNCAILCCEFLEDLQQFNSLIAVQARSWFIQDNERRVRNHLNWNTQAFLLATRYALHEGSTNIGLGAFLQLKFGNQLFNFLNSSFLVRYFQHGCEEERFWLKEELPLTVRHSNRRSFW